jgi:sec-independent protein translocase protein TatA
MPFELGLPEVILVLVIALLFLGPKRLPEAGQALGRGIREFKEGVTGKDTPPEIHHQSSYRPPTTYTPPTAYYPPSSDPPA